ncbi:hypothetical protein FRC07_014322 [Ceratobasidium sp. 392]|nr:hypothetical protein FRC07_014322 [Ceratobasidium sp. 392]
MSRRTRRNQHLKPYSANFDPQEVESLGQQLCNKFGWETPHQFQLDGIGAQLTGRDAIVHVPTSSGKTAIAAGPFSLPSAANFITIFVIPLLALQEEMETSFASECNISAVAVNSQTIDNDPELLERIVRGEYRVLLISPESLLSPRFIERVLSLPEFANRVLSVVIDEAHCVSLYGAGFRKEYGRLPVVRTFLPQGVPFVGLSVTLTPKVLRDLEKRLELQANYHFINEGNDRLNVTLICRRCIHPLKSLLDSAFVIPSNTRVPSDIDKTFFYVDNVEGGTKAVDFLTSRLPEHLRDQGLIRPYNATFSKQYRTEVMRLFRLGIVRVLVCTDAAGMGCNIPDIDTVVQFRSTEDIAPLHQRGGRAARKKTRSGRFVVLAEPAAYDVDPTEPADVAILEPEPQKKTRKKKGKTNESRKGRTRQQFQGRPGTKKKKKIAKGAEPEPPVEPPVHDNSPGSGVYAFIQARTCRRQVLAKIFNNPAPKAELTVPCCDVCNPEVLDAVAPPPLQRQRRKYKPKAGEINRTLESALLLWREEVCERDFSYLSWAPDAILNDESIESIARRSDVRNKEKLQVILEGWGYWDEYGDELLDQIQGVLPEPPPAPPKRVRKVPAPRQKTTLVNNTRAGDAKVDMPIDSGKATRGRAKRRLPEDTETVVGTHSKRQKSGDSNTPNIENSLVAAETALIRIPAAPTHLQWGISAVRAAPGQTPVVLSQR